MSIDVAFVVCLLLSLIVGLFLGLLASPALRAGATGRDQASEQVRILDQLQKSLGRHETNLLEFGDFVDRGTAARDIPAAVWQREISAQRQSNHWFMQLLDLWTVVIRQMNSGDVPICRQVDAYRTDCETLESELSSAAGAVEAGELGGLTRVVKMVLDHNQLLNSAVMRMQRELLETQTQLRMARVESRVDSLTHLGNRRAFDERLAELHHLFERTGEKYALTMLDVDWFKRLNDEFGHATGDNVLATIAKVLKSSCRLSDSVFRYGGEEFAVLSASTTLDGAMILANRMRATIAEAKLLQGQTKVPFTVSAGVADARPGQGADATLRLADAALYAAKSNGRNRVERCESAEPPQIVSPAAYAETEQATNPQDEDTLLMSTR